MHFALLDRRLRALASHYGALPAHDGLWEAADATRHDLIARLAVVPQVLEARGLDVTPETIRRLESAGDTRSATILRRIYTDEIGHVAAGNRWFRNRCEDQGIDSVSTFTIACHHHCRGALNTPITASAREPADVPRARSA